MKARSKIGSALHLFFLTLSIGNCLSQTSRSGNGYSPDLGVQGEPSGDDCFSHISRLCPPTTIKLKIISNPPFSTGFQKAILRALKSLTLDKCCFKCEEFCHPNMYETRDCTKHDLTDTDHRIKLNITYVKKKADLIRYLKRSKVHIGFPVVVSETTDLYKGQDFVPAMEYTLVFLAVVSPGKVLLDAVLKSWPLLVATLLLTAIAGEICWGLVRNS